MNLKILPLAALLLWPPLAAAASCTLTVADLAFGDYRPNQATANDSTGMVSIACDNPAMEPETVTYSLQLGPSGNGQRASRAMQSGGEVLRYNLYTDAARSQVWGDGSEGTMAFTGGLMLPSMRTAQHAVYGRLFERQPVRPGSYGDVLQVTLVF